MSAPARKDPWWKHAVCYQIYVRSFADADGDGVGDLPGITARLPYLSDLGVDAIWITPFYASPQHDHGYDVADYCGVDPLFGTLDDFDALLGRAHELGLRVIVDLVPNHTSSDHPWFQAALAAAPGSPERARYLFREGRGPAGEEPPNNWQSVFGGPAWTRVEDGQTGPAQWYLHLFDTTQPDLDWTNPEVPAMFENVLRFWLDRGVDGFRIDVAHGMYKAAGLPDSDHPEPNPVTADDEDDPSMVELPSEDEPMWDRPEVHDLYRRWHQILASYDGDRMGVAEAWTATPEAMARYVRPDELQQCFNFHWLSAPWSATAFAKVITGTLDAVGSVGASATWVLSNHDVVRHVTRYGGGARGLARGRATLLAMLALPGSAYVYQGEELGLEQVDVPPELRRDPRSLVTGLVGRDGCRVPLPWGGEQPPYEFGPGAGQPWLPQPSDWAALTVAAQKGVAGSTLEFYRQALAVRRSFAETAGDQVEMLDLGADVLAFRRGDLVCLLNCGAAAVPVPSGEVVLCSGDAPGAPDTATWLLG
jgi:alpha-glucosidase